MLVKKVVIDKANRLYKLSPDIQSFLPSDIRGSLIRRSDVLDLATFTWPVAPEQEQLDGQKCLRLATQDKINRLNEELAGWFQSYHGAKIDPAKEIFIGGGISSLIFTLALAFIDNGDIAFVPELGIPLYRRVTTACGGEPVGYTVSLKNDWMPDFGRVHTQLGRVARIFFLNSPHNPTGAELTEKEMTDLVWLAGRENILVVNDAAYAAISGRKHFSLMSVNGGKRVGVEVYSFAYHFGLAAIPFGFVVGNREIINGIKQASRIMPSFVPEYYVDLALTAIRQYPSESLRQARAAITRNLAEGIKLLNTLGLEKSGFDSVPFLWAKIERRRQAVTVAGLLYRRNRILVVPGTAFGDAGEGFLRLSLAVPIDSYGAAGKRIKKRHKLARPENER
jgi:LL-diaminopimelate aminotransferase